MPSPLHARPRFTERAAREASARRLSPLEFLCAGPCLPPVAVTWRPSPRLRGGPRRSNSPEKWTQSPTRRGRTGAKYHARTGLAGHSPQTAVPDRAGGGQVYLNAQANSQLLYGVPYIELNSQAVPTLAHAPACRHASARLRRRRRRGVAARAQTRRPVSHTRLPFPRLRLPSRPHRRAQTLPTPGLVI